ncbi:hypothetical protein RhiirA4_457229 [Rhizophagus irregularis]|uniref:Uncharacterized protein n=1 Tax=Rhizophagus irregularis TaxID=588596 RepID=A0A2I1G9F2_9GLOM|nr:hypothetical protein RhiirA4_457229 [Rhizophagus irregularis]
MEEREKYQALSNHHKNNQDNNASSTQHTRYLVGGKADKENIHPETNKLTFEKRDFQKEQDNIEEVVESLTNEEKLHIAAHNIDRIASIPSIQKLHNLLEFIKKNNIDIMVISETNIDYC